ncbi:hypothetical protein [Vibrio maritimus]|uniref:hypothetical protein n=1 Tax=Vibrio maritimus TaxID=990268 RepID=UPI001F2C9953|nr:hypothetical protein [Vibrio maritimus]
MKKLVLMIAAVSALTLSGCSQRIADMTVASSKNVNMNSTGFVEGERVEGSDATPIILFPIGIPNVKEAMDKAIEQNPCAVALNDVVIESGAAAFLIGQAWYDVEGTLVLDTNKEGCEQYSSL